MGTACLSYPPMPPISTLLIIIVTTTLINSVNGCDLDSCWNKFLNAQSQTEKMESDDVCIPLRTYYICLISNKKGCKGNIKYHSMFNGIKNQLRNKNCTIEGPVSSKDPSNNSGPFVGETLMCNYPGKKIHRVCSLFGDPHLITFKNEFQTCKIKGAWPLINNRHLTVQVTNDLVVENGAATATSQLTIVIKKNIDCAADSFVTYQAQNDYLPSTFDDGHIHYGPDRSVQLIEKSPGKHVEIFLRYIDTMISVQRIGQYFTFAIKMPEEVINSSEENNLELCVTGCPKSEIIQYQEIIAKNQNNVLEISTKQGENIVISRSDALELCRKAELTDFYLDSCVFDLLTTGDKNFTTAAHRAWQDSVSMMPTIKATQENRTDLKVHDDRYFNHASSSWTSSQSSFRITLVTILCILMQLAV